MPAANARPVTSAQCLVLTPSPERQDLGGEEWLVSGSYSFLQSLLPSLASSCLSWMAFVPAAPRRSHFGDMSQASAWMILLHPSLLSLLPPVHPSSAFFFLFWKDTALKFKCRKKWLHFLFRSVSQKASKSSLAETQGLFRMGNIISHSFACSRCGFHPPLLSHTRADGDSGVDCCCLPWLPLWEGWGPFPRGDQSSYSMSPK